MSLLLSASSTARPDISEISRSEERPPNSTPTRPKSFMTLLQDLQLRGAQSLLSAFRLGEAVCDPADRARPHRDHHVPGTHRIQDRLGDVVDALDENRLDAPRHAQRARQRATVG